MICVGYGKDNPTLVTKIQLKVYKGYIKSSTLIEWMLFLMFSVLKKYKKMIT